MTIEIKYNDQSVYYVRIDLLFEKIEVPSRIRPLPIEITKVTFDDREDNFLHVKVFKGKDLWKEKMISKGQIDDITVTHFELVVE